jgi:hypothetical protein
MGKEPIGGSFVLENADDAVAAATAAALAAE